MTQKPLSLHHIAQDCVDVKADAPEFRHRAALAFVTGDIAAGERESGVKITYGNLKILTNRAANAFAATGLPAGSRVLIRLNNTPEFPITLFGALKAGFVVVPVSPLLTATELKKILTHSRAGLIVSRNDALLKTLAATSPRTAKRLFVVSDKDKAIPKRTLRLQDELLRQPETFSYPACDANAPAISLYTSGTEGQAKAVLHAHRSVPAHDTRMRNWLDFRQGDVVFNTSALNWSYALNCGLLDVLRHGGTSLIYDGPTDPANLVHFINRFGVTTFQSVPVLYRRLTDYLATHHIDFSSLRQCLSAGDILDQSVCQDFFRLTGQVIRQGFGMTEHSVYIYQSPAEKSSACTIGRPGDPQSVKILRADLTETKVGEAGEIATHKSAPGLFLGYVSAKGAVQLPLQGDYFMSGDMALRDENGEFHFLGRRDDVMSVGGYRVSPLEVEAVLRKFPGVADCAVTQAGMASRAHILATIVAKPGLKAKADFFAALLKHCQAHLAPYKVPKKFLFAEKIPKTANHKPKRGLLRGKKR